MCLGKLQPALMLEVWGRSENRERSWREFWVRGWNEASFVKREDRWEHPGSEKGILPWGDCVDHQLAHQTD